MLFTDEQAEILLHIADILVPLQKWIENKSFNPQKFTNDTLPWRLGESINFEVLRLTEFMESFLRQSSYEQSLYDRWMILKRNPFQFHSYNKLNNWRNERGLYLTAEFGGLESRNLLADQNDSPIVRIIFYEECLIHLMNAYEKQQPQTKGDWEQFVDFMWKETHPSWGPTIKPSSRSFLIQYTRDILHCAMNMRNNAPPPWSTALLIELGEHRRVGNHYTVEHTAKAVTQFEHALQLFLEERMN
ncbi:hypothetical protein [Bacillus subtilis]|uniref:hypothetical protein n=1 Tax=Bacillus subtilis TaxID=1423 RepID=UPI003977F55F